MTGTLPFAAALDQLRGKQKSAKGVSLYSRFVNRPAGRVLAAAAYRAGLTPNQVTAISALCTLAGLAGIALLAPSWPLGVGVYLTLAVGFAFDSADGQLARLRGVGSPAGEWLDHVVDCAKHVLLHTAVLISFYRFFDLDPGWLLLPLAFQLIAVLIFFGGVLTEKLLPPRTGPGTPPSNARAIALLPVDYGVFCLVFLLLGSPDAFLAGYAALAAANAVVAAALLAKWFRSLKRA